MNQKKRLNLFVASHDVENFCVFCVFRGMFRNKGAMPILAQEIKKISPDDGRFICI
jgi:hypothetical protein